MDRRRRAERPSSLKTVTIPTSVRGLSSYAFDDSDNLEYIAVEDGNPYLFTEDGVLYQKDPEVKLIHIPRCAKGEVTFRPEMKEVYLENMPNLEGAIFPEGIENVRMTGLTALASADFPASAAYIYIQDCPALENLKIAEENPNYTFDGNILYELYTESSSQPDKEIVYVNPNVTSVKLPADIRFIRAGTFARCEKLTTLSIAEGNRLYESRDNTIYSTKNNMGKCRLEDVAGGLTTFHLPADVNSITTLEIPSDDYIFEGSYATVLSLLKHLSYITVADVNEDYSAEGGILFSKPTYSTTGGRAVACVPQTLTGKVVLPADVREIGEQRFFNSQISSVTIPDRAVIGYAAFANSRKLTEVIFAGSAEAENSSFVGTPWFESHEPGVLYAGTTVIGLIGDVTEVTLKPGTKTISTEAFTSFPEETSPLTKITLPEGLEAIKTYAFIGCGKLTSIYLPASLKEIGYYAFGDCYAVKEYYTAMTSPLVLEDRIFPDNLSGATLYVPEGCKEAFAQAEEWSRFEEIKEFDVTAAIGKAPGLEEATEVARYAVDGRRLATPERGINIVHMSDGSIRKVVVR